MPPNLIASSGSDSYEQGESFDAIDYCETYTFVDEYQQLPSGNKTLNWPMDELRGTSSSVDNYGRIMFYNQDGDFNPAISGQNTLFWGDGTGTSAEGAVGGEYIGLPFADDDRDPITRQSY